MLMFLAVACGASAWSEGMYFPPQTRNQNTGRFYFRFLINGRSYRLVVGVVVTLLMVAVVSDSGSKSSSGSMRT
jgi:hypothetical protein